MKKIDFKKTLKHLYLAKTGTFTTVDVPTMKYLMIDGHGDPNIVQEYRDALEVLYTVAYKLKFASKAESRDYVVPPLEGLWWADDMASFAAGEKDLWDWTLMLMLPDWITRSHYDNALASVKDTKNPVSLDKLRMQALNEGKCVQILHIGPYDDEAKTLSLLHDEWLPENGYKETGKHHEIYLSDPRRTPPEKLKTLLRQPVQPL